MRHRKPAQSQHRARRHPIRWFLLTITVLLIVVMAAVAWVGMDALRARGELEAAATQVHVLQGQVEKGDRKAAARRWDTLLAAAVAQACRPRGISAPKWTRRAPLTSWWFPADGGGLLAARTMARTPIDFSRLGIWLDASAFQTA